MSEATRQKFWVSVFGIVAVVIAIFALEKPIRVARTRHQLEEASTYRHMLVAGYALAKLEDYDSMRRIAERFADCRSFASHPRERRDGLASILAKFARHRLDEFPLVLRDSNEAVRLLGCQTCSVLGPDAAPVADELTDLAESDPSADVRLTAVRALGDIGPAAAHVIPDLQALDSFGAASAANQDATLAPPAHEVIKAIEKMRSDYD
ncbi:MAG: hypothetical protein AAF517_00875 [Planctomycetota bacterium]